MRTYHIRFNIFFVIFRGERLPNWKMDSTDMKETQLYLKKEKRLVGQLERSWFFQW